MTSLVQKRLPLSELRQPYVGFIAAWVLAMVCVPIARWTLGDGIIPAASLITTLLQSAAVWMILQHHWGFRRTLVVFGIVAVVTYLAEFIGSKTGIPFGAYRYTLLLQPQFFEVPLIIPLAWFMMLAPAWAAASLILDQNVATPLRRVAFILISALAITAWDLYLDPQMVGWGFWVWDEPSGYFGIPWTNYLGWILTAALVTALVRPDRLPTAPLITVYGIVWILQSIGLAVFWGQPGPAVFGFLAMGAVLAFALRNKSAKG